MRLAQTLHEAAFMVDGEQRRRRAPKESDETGDSRARQVRRLLAQQGRQRLLEIAHRDAAQIKDGQQRIEAARSPRPSRQDGRRKPEPLPGRGCPCRPIPDLGTPKSDRSDARLDRAFRPIPVAHEPGPAILEPLSLM
jgi:hypothetical protein